MHSQSWRMTLLSITAVSSFYAGLSMKTAHAAPEANPDTHEGTVTLEPTAPEETTDTVQSTSLPPVISEPSIQPRFASQSKTQVSPQPASVNSDASLHNPRPNVSNPLMREIPDRATLLQRLTMSQPQAATPAPPTTPTPATAANAQTVSPTAEAHPPAPLENSAQVNSTSVQRAYTPTTPADASTVFEPNLAVTPDIRSTGIASPIPLATQMRMPPAGDSALLESAVPQPIQTEPQTQGELVSPEVQADSTANVPEAMAAIEATSLASPEPSPTTAAAPSPYQIQPGDTLLSIADELNVSVEELAQANNIKDVNLIMAGAELIIPVVDEKPAETATRGESVVAADFAQLQADGSEVNAAIPTAIAASSNGSITQSSADLLTHLQTTATRQVDSEALLARLQPFDQDPELAFNPSPELTASSGLVTPPESLEANSENNIETAPNQTANLTETEITETDIYTANLIAAVNETPSSQPEAIEIAVIPAEPPTLSILANRLPVPSLPLPTAAAPRVTPSLPRALMAAAPLSPNILGTRRPAPGDIVEPQMPILPNAQEYYPQSTAFNGYVWPAPGRISSGYGWRWGRMHRGIDIAAPTGTPVMAAAPGVVEFAGWNNGGYGNLVDIRHPDGSMTRYAHNSRLTVRAGQSVLQGQLISEVGSTGYSTGPHLHFEIHQPNQGTVNPIALLPNR